MNYIPVWADCTAFGDEHRKQIVISYEREYSASLEPLPDSQRYTSIRTMKKETKNITERLGISVNVEANGVVKTIKFMNDYGCTSLWWTGHGRVGSIEYDELSLSKELIDLLEKRDKRYDNHLNWADPAAILPATEERIKAFEAEGIMLWKKLQEELKPYYVVTFFSNILGRAVETEEELSK